MPRAANQHKGTKITKATLPTSTIRVLKDYKPQQMTYVKQRHLQTTDAAPAGIS